MFVDSCDLALVETRAGGGCAALAWGVAYEVADGVVVVIVAVLLLEP